MKAGTYAVGLWGRIAGRIVRHPGPVLAAGLVVFGGLAMFTLAYAPSGFTNSGSAASNSQSTRGTAILIKHFPAAQSNPTNLILAYPASVWQKPSVLDIATASLDKSPEFSGINGPLTPNGTRLTDAQIISLYTQLGPPKALPIVPPGSPECPARSVLRV